MASSSKAASNSESVFREEALVLAADLEAGNIHEVTKLLGKKADINYVHIWIVDGVNMSKTPLMAAVGGGHAEVVKFFITRKANVNLAEPCNGITALHGASVTVNVPMIELLLSKGAKHDVRDKIGSTPLHSAAGHGHIRTVVY